MKKKLNPRQAYNTNLFQSNMRVGLWKAVVVAIVIAMVLAFVWSVLSTYGVKIL
jgi:hypothetical protein